MSKLTGTLSTDRLLNIHRLMLRARMLEDHLIKLYRTGDAFFWTGGPGEEAWGVPIGLLLNKGQGSSYDWFFPHYRSTAVVVAMGVSFLDSIRMMFMRATDPFTGGRYFCNHYAVPAWNVAPVTSPIAVQYGFAIGTATSQSRAGAKALTVVSGGDAGTAEADFEFCLVWSSRPGRELPILITVQNNFYGISTRYAGQHGEKHIGDRARTFGIRAREVNGLDPVESYIAIEEEMNYIRKTGRPSFIEARVSRLYGHSSADGANRDPNEEDPLEVFEVKLLKEGFLTTSGAKFLRDGIQIELRAATEQARSEAVPLKASAWDHIYSANESANWRDF